MRSSAGKDLSVVLQTLEIAEATFHRRWQQYGGMNREESKRLKQIVADKELDIQIFKHLADGIW